MKAPRHYGWVILAMATLVVFAALGLARFGYSVVLPAMQAGLGMNNTEAGVLATANLAGYLLLSVAGGALAARYGSRVVITAGLIAAGAGMGLTGAAENFPQAAVWRFLTGLGSGASNVPVMALLAAWFGTHRRGLASGIAVSGSSLALIVLGPAVPILLHRFNEGAWRSCWYLFGFTAVVLAFCGFALLRNHPADKGLEPIGADPAQPGAGGRGQALQWGKVYKSTLVWHLGSVYTAYGFSYIIYMTFFYKGLIAERGYSQEGAGTLFMVLGWCSLFCGLIWGTVSDVIGRKYSLLCVYVVQALSFTLFALWPTPSGSALSAILFGLTAWSIPAIMAAACGDVLGARLAPAALGFITLFLGIGQAVGPSVAGAIADRTGSFTGAFVLAGAVALAGAIGSWFIRTPNPGERQQTDH